MSDIVFLYIPTPSQKVADEIANTLIAEKLAACVNIHAPMISVYGWQGTIERREEIPLIVKTTQIATGAVNTRVQDLHPDDTPCIVAIPVQSDGSSQPFMEWVRASVSKGTNM